MTARLRVAFWSYLIALVGLAAFGVIYLVRPEFMPYHAVAVGMPWDAVSPPFQVLILALMKALGGTQLALVLALGAFLLKPFRAGEMWARFLLPATWLVYAFPALYATLFVRAKTTAETPWLLVVLGIVLVLVGFVLSLPVRRKASS